MNYTKEQEQAIFLRGKNIMVSAGEILDVEELVTMDWLYENVIGSIPERSELEEGVGELLKLQGL